MLQSNCLEIKKAAIIVDSITSNYQTSSDEKIIRWQWWNDNSMTVMMTSMHKQLFSYLSSRQWD